MVMLLVSFFSTVRFIGISNVSPALEDQLEEFVLEQRAACRGLNTVQLHMKAVELAKSNNIDNFKGNPSWCYRFMKRKNYWCLFSQLCGSLVYQM
jgi:hypothetical protein